MQSWRSVWRRGLVPQLSNQALLSLHRALATDDARLLQGTTISPPPLLGLLGRTVEGTCVLGWCGWQGEERKTVGDVERWFGRTCIEADRRLGGRGKVRSFFNWFDDAPRNEMRRELLREIARELHRRHRAALRRPRRAA
jgi:hypothetical protein